MAAVHGPAPGYTEQRRDLPVFFTHSAPAGKGFEPEFSKGMMNQVFWQSVSLDDHPVQVGPQESTTTTPVLDRPLYRDSDPDSEVTSNLADIRRPNFPRRHVVGGQELSAVLEEEHDDEYFDRLLLAPPPPPPYGEDAPGVNTHPVDIHVREVSRVSGEFDGDEEHGREDVTRICLTDEKIRADKWLERRKRTCKQFLSRVCGSDRR